MEHRYETRLAEMLEDAQVSPRILEGVLARLEAFVQPFAEALRGSAPRRHALEYLTGLISKLDNKTGEGIAYPHDQECQGIQKFIGYASWDCGPLLATLADQVGQRLGEPDAVLVFDPSGFAKKGTKSVGVARQWCGRLGKVENCQVGVFMAYVSRKEHALVNMRLYLSEEWARDKPHYYFSNAAPETTLKELARVAKASHRVEECFERAKGEAGLADYQGRNWKAWHHHQTLAILAAWFLTEETRRGKNPDARADDSATSAVDRGADRVSLGRQSSVFSLSSRHALVATQRTGEAVCASIP
ncbi:MAG: transposase [Isosphaeraceae bacterium]